MPDTRPLRFGLEVNKAESATAWTGTARDVEARGFSTLLVCDHLHRLSPLPALAAAGAVTTTLRLGSYVLNAGVRDAATLAKELVTVDFLTGGRLEVGLGAGWYEPDFAAVGVPIPPPRQRIDRLRRTLQQIGEAWAMGDGGDNDVLPRPVQRPRPPVLLPAGGPAMTRLAAEWADIVDVNGSHLTVGAVKRKLDELAGHAGSRFARIELSQRLVHLGPSAAGAAAHLGIDADDALARSTVVVGDADAIASQLLERRRETGVSYFVVGHRFAAEAAAVIAALTTR
jgi:probable F420-dependent oxidoreductase